MKNGAGYSNNNVDLTGALQEAIGEIEALKARVAALIVTQVMALYAAEK